MDTNLNRKDKEPKDTVALIKNILTENEVETKITSIIKYKDKWFSNRIEFSNIYGKGTNGKGISEDFALASGYAEFMERLQTKMIFDGLYYNKVRDMDNISNNPIQAKKIMQKYFKKYLLRNGINDEEIDKLLSTKEDQYSNLKKYYNVFTNRIEKLPERFIFSICGSNGLCSGNTKGEAFNQGLCEVFERYINYKIYHDKDVVLPVIPKKYFLHLNSYNMINELEHKGYTIYIKDCTLNGTFPVLGLLIINKAKTKYYFKLGSDINADICLQRCITEMFQGLDINTTFRLQMNETDKGIFKDFWNLRDMESEYYKTVRAGTGYLPRNIFINIESNNGNLSPFRFENLTNLEVSKILVGIVRKQQCDLFIKDYSCLGFPTLRVFVTNMSEIIDYSSGIIETQENLSEIKKILLRENDKEILIRELSWRLKKLSDVKLISSDYYFMNLLGISLNKSYDGILRKNILYVIAVLSVYLHQYDDAVKYIERYHNLCAINSRTSKIENIVIEALKNNIQKEVLLQFLATIIGDNEQENILKFVEYIYNVKNKELDIPLCRDCNYCSLKKFCEFSAWKKVHKIVYDKYLVFEEEFNYYDDFYKML